MQQLFIIVFLFCVGACRGQEPILPILQDAQGIVEGAYYKDLDNELGKFVGTWKYTSGTTSFTVTLLKKAQYHDEVNKYYEDVIYGEYRYVENGVEKVNTIPLLTSGDTDPYTHNIVGNFIMSKTNVPICNDCGIHEKRLNLTLNDPTRSEVNGLSGKIIVRRVDVGTTQKIKITLSQSGNIIYTEGNPPQYNSLSVPWGEYILTKQP